MQTIKTRQPAVPRARGRPKKEQPDANTRQLILDAAIEVFRDEGYHGASVASICKKALIANGTFYIHFPGKAELYTELLAGTLKRLAEALAKAQVENAGITGAELERRDIELIVDFFEANSDVLLIAINERGLGPSAQASLIEMFATQRAADFKLGRKTGQFRPDIHPLLTGYAETGLMTEVLRWWLKNPRAISKAQLVRELLALRLRLTHPPV